jgi:hypothetical protein
VESSSGSSGVTGPASPPVEVLLAREITADEERMVEAELRSIGLEVAVRRVVPHRSPGDLQWIVLLALPLQAILSNVGGELGRDLYRCLKRVAGRLLDARRQGRPGARTIMVHDRDLDLRIVVEPDLPLSALEALADLDRGSLPPNPLRYDRDAAEWRSVQG